jgi:hypothetical protein
VKKTVSVYELKSINLLVIHKRLRKSVLINQHLYPAPYLTLQFKFRERFLHLVPMYLGAKNNKDLPGHQKLLQAFLEKLLKAEVIPTVPLNTHQSTKD